jgi:hypothetical protein
VNNGLPTNAIIASLAIKGDTILAGTKGSGVFISTNNGSSWTAGNWGLGNLYILSLAINGNDIYAGTYGGVWKTSLVGFGIKDINNNESDIAIYPNPATNNIIIESSYASLRGSQQAAIEILNIQGQLIKSLSVNNINKTSIDVSSLQSGLYVVEAKTGNGVIVNKFIKE